MKRITEAKKMTIATELSTNGHLRNKEEWETIN
jgi:hypothetical protein